MKFSPIALSIVLLLLSACGSDSSQNINKYANDQMIVISTGTVSLSTGESDSYEKEKVKTYLEVESIPDKYNYSGDIEGPFKLEITTEDGVIEGHEYSSSAGVEIIDDDFEAFESIDFTIKQGSDTPDDIQFGESYNYYSSATLFDSTSGQELGFKTVEMTMVFDSFESITVLAGTFDTVKVDFEMVYEVDNGAEQLLANMSGSMWFDTNHGYSLKSTTEGTFNYPNLSVLADTISSTELKFVYIEEDESNTMEAKTRSLKLSLVPVNLDPKIIAAEVVSSFN